MEFLACIATYGLIFFFVVRHFGIKQQLARKKKNNQ